MTDGNSSLDELLAKAKDVVAQAPDAPIAPLLLGLCDAVARLQADQSEMRKEAFREGIRGAAKVIQNRQKMQGSILSDIVAENGGNADVFAQEAAKVANVAPVKIEDLRKLRQKLNTALEGNDEIDDELKRIYYSVVMDRNPSAADILPPGSPSRSLDVATFLVERVLWEGWWTLGNGGINVPEKPLAKVGRYSGQDSRPQSAANPVLTLLSAWVLTLIETIKGK